MTDREISTQEKCFFLLPSHFFVAGVSLNPGATLVPYVSPFKPKFLSPSRGRGKVSG
jgi:hypothetical protein